MQEPLHEEPEPPWEEHEPPHLQLDAEQPIHFTPRFLALIMYIIAAASIATTITVAIMLVIFAIIISNISYSFHKFISIKSNCVCYFFNAYSLANLLLDVIVTTTKIATIASTAISPGTKPVPSL